MTGTDGLSAGIDQNLWVPIVKDYSSRLSNMANYIDRPQRCRRCRRLRCGDHLLPFGPLLQYDPKIVTDVPKTPAALLAWAKAHPNKFAMPAGELRPRSDLPDGLPYLLGDKDPSDP